MSVSAGSPSPILPPSLRTVSRGSITTLPWVDLVELVRNASMGAPYRLGVVAGEGICTMYLFLAIRR